MGQPVIHFEILGKDADRTQSYYAELFGWEIKGLEFENPTQYGLVDREGNTNADGVVDDRLRIVAPDDAADVALYRRRHRPRLTEVLVGHRTQLGHVAAHVVTARVEALHVARGIVDAPKRRLRVGADRGDPLPVAVVVGLVAVHEQAHEVALAPAPVDLEGLGASR